MGLENGKWRVAKGDCLWNIAKSVYSNAYRWKDIASANGISQSSPIIYPNQLLTLPNISGSGGSSAPSANNTNKVRIDWFALTSGTEREMQAVWSYDKSEYFWVKWELKDQNGHLHLVSQEKSYDRKEKIQILDSREGFNICSLSIIPSDKDGNQIVGTAWVTVEYDFRNNPPGTPSTPTVEIDDNNKMTITLENIDEKINADSIEIAIYKDDTTKYKTATVPINKDARFATYVCTVDDGSRYKVRCRAVRGTIYGGWCDFTSNEQACPTAPSEITTLRLQVISEQMSKEYAVFVEWDEVPNADQYYVEYTTNVAYFDTGSNVSSAETKKGKGPRILIAGFNNSNNSNNGLGHEYFFRVRSMNSKGNSKTWSAVKSLVIGTKPAAPTTWSNTSSGIVGEDINLYWSHNSSDGSIETYARIEVIGIDSANPTVEALKEYVVVENTKPEEDKNKTSHYTINTTDSKWALVQSGFIIKWKVQTAGVSSDYSDWSVEREINVYAKPTLTLDLKNQNGVSVTEVNEFPLYISVLARPLTQIPISYYLEIVANQGYETTDNAGQVKVISPGDIIYQRYYDPERNAWEFLAELDPSNIDLENNVSYTINCTVSMDSGLTATEALNFTAYFNDIFYNVGADVVVNKETLEATIRPYCMEYYEENGETKSRITNNCILAVYRREYNGKFTEILSGIENAENMYVTDPHPSLDYARYRVIAKSKDTGAVSYSDIAAVKVGDPAIVIQWSEKWNKFEIGSDGEGTVEPSWSGSMIKLPYNVDTSEENSTDKTLVEYVGREHPVSYYGTQLGESLSLSADIESDDKETIYALRRLKAWTGDVYVREPTGIGYWATVSVSMNKNHNELVIPVSINVTRVEGGI